MQPTLTTETGETYPLATGCALDGHYGWHNTYRVVTEVAASFGYPLSDSDSAIVDTYANGEWSQHADASDAMHEIADEATDWLNAHTTNGYWHWEMGELSLVPSCDQDDTEPCLLADSDECAIHGMWF